MKEIHWVKPFLMVMLILSAICSTGCSRGYKVEYLKKDEPAPFEGYLIERDGFYDMVKKIKYLPYED